MFFLSALAANIFLSATVAADIFPHSLQKKWNLIGVVLVVVAFFVMVVHPRVEKSIGEAISHTIVEAISHT